MNENTKTATDSATNLCHKCGGTFRRVSGLYECGCVSSYERGIEKSLTMDEAKAEQERWRRESIALFNKQGRSEADIAYIMSKYKPVK